MSKNLLDFYFRRVGVLSEEGISRDPPMARSNIDDSSTGRST